MSRRSVEITPELLIRAYRAGFFPMAETREADRLYWLDPEQRGILPLEDFHVPKRLARNIRTLPFEGSPLHGALREIGLRRSQLEG